MLDIDWEEPASQACPDCGGRRQLVTGQVFNDGTSSAAFLAFLYNHESGREVYLDLIIGTWEDNGAPSTRLTFSTRTGPTEGGVIGSTLLDGRANSPDYGIVGKKVSRDEGLNHPLLPIVRRCNDTVLAQIPAVAQHLTGPHTHESRRRRWPWHRAQICPSHLHAPGYVYPNDRRSSRADPLGVCDGRQTRWSAELAGRPRGTLFRRRTTRYSFACAFVWKVSARRRASSSEMKGVACDSHPQRSSGRPRLSRCSGSR
ncbi:hypothetical protein ACWFNE_01730 [Cellulomonas sp. NPDC055163]